LLRVDTHDAPQQEHVVRRVLNLLGIEDDLLELASLSEALDHLRSQPVTNTQTVTSCYSADKLTFTKATYSSNQEIVRYISYYTLLYL